jgi:EmrB/QacA subfamily drug resistance transporter
VTASQEKLRLAVLFAGVLMAALDIAIVGPALPAMDETFAVGGRALPWVFSSYVLFYLIGTPLLGKRSDRRGRRSVFVEGLAVFAIGSLLVATAPTFGLLLAGRAIQGFGAGGLFPVAAAVIADTVPLERRGRTLGLIGAVFGVAFLLGPLLGGVLLHWSWRWLFLINVPIAMLLIVLALQVLPETKRPELPAVDAAGVGLLTIVLAALIWGVNQLDTERWLGSLLSARVWPCALVVALALPLLWSVERRAADPVLAPALFRSVQLRLVGAIALAAGAVEAGMVFLPKVAVLGLGVDVASASLMMLPLVLMLGAAAPLAGGLLDRVGARLVLQGGLSLTIAGLVLFALLPLDLVSFYVAGAVIGCGLAALLGAPLRYVTLQEAGEDRRGAGQGLLTLFVSIGQLVGTAVIGGVVGSAADELGGYRQALLAVAVACTLALMLSAALRGRVSRA